MSRKIAAIIKKEALEEVLTALRKIGVAGVSVEERSSREARLDLCPSEVKVETAVQTITRAATTGSRFDGIIVVYPEVVGTRLLRDASCEDSDTRIVGSQSTRPVAVGE